jgi:predicted TIM-barrel fold metal-dependent hydrolase
LSAQNITIPERAGWPPYYDTVVHDPSLRLLVERVGAEHVVMGTDYPFPMVTRLPWLPSLESPARPTSNEI